MASGIALTLTGAEAAIAWLRGKERAFRNRVLRRTIGPGAAIIARAMKAGAPRQTGAMKNAIGSVVRTYRNADVTLALMGARVGFARMGPTRTLPPRKKGGVGVTLPARMRDPVRYIHLVARGVRAHGGKLFGRVTKHPGVAARPFMAIAVASTQGFAMSRIRDRLAEAMVKNDS